MSYYISLFSPATYMAFSHSSQNISGFRLAQEGIAARVCVGDKLICYMTKLSRWVGVFEVLSPYFIDNTPVFQPADDPFCVRFHIKALAWLAPDQAPPIQDPVCWRHLSFTMPYPLGSHAWTGIVRGSLNKLTDSDGQYLESLLLQQAKAPTLYPLSELDEKRLRPPVINRDTGPVAVTVPDDEHAEAEPTITGLEDPSASSESEHTRIQAQLAEIGEKMGMRIWLPKNDRQRVLGLWHPAEERTLLDHLPLNYNDATLRTIENIDVLWIRRRAIIHAFEVEHTTSIYSGLLRMADLMSLQPNLTIKAHIVAPEERREKVMQEITRPVFSLMEGGALAETCSYMPYRSVYELMGERNLAHMNDSVLDEYIEYAQDADF